MKEEKLTFRLSLGTLEALDNLRRVEKDVPSRGEMLVRLIERAAGDVSKPVKGQPKKK
jgi:hypothetical protein